MFNLIFKKQHKIQIQFINKTVKTNVNFHTRMGKVAVSSPVGSDAELDLMTRAADLQEKYSQHTSVFLQHISVIYIIRALIMIGGV